MKPLIIAAFLCANSLRVFCDQLPESESAFEMLTTSKSGALDPKRAAYLLKEPFRILRYDVDQFSKEGIKEKAFIDAVKEIQKKLKQPVTGVLSVKQFERVRDSSKDYEMEQIIPSGEITLMETGIFLESRGERVIAEGTLEIVGDRIANPINLHRLVADHRTLTCRNVSTELREDPFGRIVALDESEYEIVSWTDEEIVCKADYRCRTEKVIIGLKTKEVTIVTTNRDNPDCKDFPKLEAPRVSRLSNADKVCHSIYDERRKQAEELVCDHYKERSRALFKE